jgi:hypothetical protein
MSVATAAITAVHINDPKKEIWDEVRDGLNDIEPLAADVLMAVYVRPTTLSIMGINGKPLEITQKKADEDNYQGVVGLVLKMGPVAFCEDANHLWGNNVPKVGDWIAVNVGDTWAFHLGKRKCRIVEDVNCKLIVQRPDIIY